MPELRLEILTDTEQLLSLSDDWSSLLGRSGQDQPTLTPAWVGTWLGVFSELGGRALKACAVWEGDRLVALAPLLWRKRWHRSVLPLRRVELVCSGEPEEDEIHSEYLGVVVERGFEEAAARVLVEAVTEGRLGEVDECVAPLMNGDDTMPALLRDTFRLKGWASDLAVVSEAPYVPLPSAWEGYLGALPSRRRRVLRRAEADIEAWAGGPPDLHVVEDAAALSKGRDILQRLHSGRWREAGQSGAFTSGRFSEFHATVMPALLSLGALEVMWLEAGGEPLAVLYNIVWRGKVQQYQAGRRVDLPPHLRPGIAIHAHAIRRAIERGRTEYDFLAGAARYKLDLALATRPLVTLQAARPGTRQTARLLLDRAAATAQRARRRLAGRKTPGPVDVSD